MRFQIKFSEVTSLVINAPSMQEARAFAEAHSNQFPAGEVRILSIVADDVECSEPPQ